jgi:hypothetical protein
MLLVSLFALCQALLQVSGLTAAEAFPKSKTFSGFAWPSDIFMLFSDYHGVLII